MINVDNIKSVKKYNWGTYFNYQVTLKTGGVSGIPNDTDNTDYQAILEWVEDGNTIEDAD